MSAKTFHQKGLRFKCSECGACCRNHGDHDRVYVGPREIDTLAALLGLDAAGFLAEHTREEDGYRLLRPEGDACRFLTADGRCSVYAARPAQCAAWPFWWENLSPERWERDVLALCPGAGQGRLYSAAEIEASAEATERALDP